MKQHNRGHLLMTTTTTTMTMMTMGSLSVCMVSTPEVSEALRQEVDLNSVLTRQCGRQANVQRVRTVTTQSNSLLQGPQHSTLPVTMAGSLHTLWLSELERSVSGAHGSGIVCVWGGGELRTQTRWGGGGGRELRTQKFITQGLSF